MKKTLFNAFWMAVALVVSSVVVASAEEKINREILPVVVQEPKTYTELDVRNTKPPAPFNVTAPALSR
jgi:hypothetical protein